MPDGFNQAIIGSQIISTRRSITVIQSFSSFRVFQSLLLFPPWSTLIIGPQNQSFSIGRSMFLLPLPIGQSCCTFPYWSILPLALPIGSFCFCLYFHVKFPLLSVTSHCGALFHVDLYCGSGMFIQDPKFPSRIRIFPSRIRIKEFKYFIQKNDF